MEKIKYIFILLVSLTLLLLISTAALSGQEEIKVLLNGSQLKFDVAPNLKNGVTLVPVRGVFESLGAKVTWNNETQSIFISADDKAISLRVGSKDASVNGTKISLLRSPEIVKGRTLIPLRFIAEALGAKVDWNSTQRAITIQTNLPEISPGGHPIDKIDLPPGFLSVQ